MRKKPTVMMNGTQIPFTYYQLVTARFALKIMSTGMTMRGVKLRDIKKTFKIKGRAAADLLPQIDALIEKYKQETAPLLNTSKN